MRNLLPILCLLLMAAGCDSGGGSTTPNPTPLPAPAPPPPPPAPEPPGTPEGLQVSATGRDFIEWTWVAVEGADSYDVHVSTNNDAMDLADTIAMATEPSYRLADLAPGASATIWVRSASGTGDDRLTSDWSGHVSGMTLPAPANVAGIWYLTHEPGPPIDLNTLAAEDECFADWWHSRDWTAEPLEHADRVLSVEQDGEAVSGVAWVVPPGESHDPESHPGWMFAGTAGPVEVTLPGTARWQEEEWTPYPYVAFEVPVWAPLVEACPEYDGQTIVLTAVGVLWELEVQDDGTVTGGYTTRLTWTIAEESWEEVGGPVPFTAEPYEP